MTNKSPHPWGVFLHARANVIDWLKLEFGGSDAEIAEKLSMNETQVTLIRERDRNFDIYPNLKIKISRD